MICTFRQTMDSHAEDVLVPSTHFANRCAPDHLSIQWHRGQKRLVINNTIDLPLSVLKECVERLEGKAT